MRKMKSYHDYKEAKNNLIVVRSCLKSTISHAHLPKTNTLSQNSSFSFMKLWKLIEQSISLFFFKDSLFLCRSLIVHTSVYNKLRDTCWAIFWAGLKSPESKLG